MNQVTVQVILSGPHGDNKYLVEVRQIHNNLIETNHILIWSDKVDIIDTRKEPL